ncbi:MAG: N-acetylmannosamine-6-phosphate 2-epimerase [Cellulosilyticaceae bacterium]
MSRVNVMDREQVIKQIKGGLIVSCQALEHEPLHSSYIMSRMAYAAMLGGAKGIRANSQEDIKAIKEVVDLPIIGIVKRDYPECEIYITTTMKEIEELVEIGVEIIALDATARMRPNEVSLEDFFKEVRSRYPDQLFMADCSTYEEGMNAQALGFDFVGTTLSGYTSYTKGKTLPDYEMMKRLVADLRIPVIAEGGIWSPDQLKEAMTYGVHAAVVGTVITRPMDITKRYVEAIR